MSAQHGTEDLKKHVRIYIAVFVVLLVLTGVTVAVSYLNLDVWQAVTVALIVASVKGTLVALYFMHLISEVKAIYWTLAICGVFFAVLMMLPSFTTTEMHYRDPEGMYPYSKLTAPAKDAGQGHAAAGH